MFDIFDLLLFAYIVVNVIMIPHTKIEEIFQVNNIYDHLYLGDKIEEYDFIIFDGVVYRTFISSLMIAGLNYVFKYPLHQIFELTTFSMLIVCKTIYLINFSYDFIARVTLGFLNILALKKVRNVVHN